MATDTATLEAMAATVEDDTAEAEGKSTQAFDRVDAVVYRASVMILASLFRWFSRALRAE